MKSLSTYHLAALNRSAVFAVAILFAILPATGLAGSNKEDFVERKWSFGFTAESYSLKQYDPAGVEVARESGPIYGMELAGFILKKDGLAIIPRAKMFYGFTDYNGSPWGQPENTDVIYYGLVMDADFGKYYRSDRTIWTLYAGAGYRMWHRDIEHTYNSSGILVPGLIESWMSFYGRLGGRADFKIADRSQLYLVAGVKLPIYTTVSMSLDQPNQILPSAQDVRMTPGFAPSLFGEFGWMINSLKLALFYEEFNNDQSETAQQNGMTFYIPETRAHSFGLNVGLMF